MSTNESLTFDTLRNANIARLPQFKIQHGTKAHTEPDGSDWTPAQWLQALIGEIGEYANIRKKYERGDISKNEFFELACDELADVQTYLDLLACQLGIDLGNATIDKFNYVSSRAGSTVRIDCNRWYYLEREDKS